MTARRSARILRVAGLSLALLGSAAAAWAQGAPPPVTLEQALTQTYWTNPTLTGKRAELRAIDEGSAIARSRGRPTVSGEAARQESYNGVNSSGRQVSAGVQLAFPLFTGGRVRNGVRAADKRIVAGEADLRGTEGEVLVQAVGAYLDVIRDRQILQLNVAQVQFLEANLEANRKRFAVAEVTRTDVAQSEARLALARSSLAAAAGQLTASEEGYRQVVGSGPGQLRAPGPLPPIPATAGEGVDIALRETPAMAQVQAESDAAHYDVLAAKADRAPSVSLSTQHGYTDYLGSLGRGPGASPNTVNATTIGVTMSVPLYQGGAASARVRQASALESQSLEQLVLAERAVVANVRAAFAQFKAAEEEIRASQTAVTSNETALEGVKAENGIGVRTTLDVLNAEQELLGARVSLVSAERNHYVAGFALLNTMGKADARALNLDIGAGYETKTNADRAKRSWSDWADGPQPAARATRTDTGAAAPPP